ncbi:hypothetical protein STEG23_018516 [Scotinomys teguina]
MNSQRLLQHEQDRYKIKPDWAPVLKRWKNWVTRINPSKNTAFCLTVYQFMEQFTRMTWYKQRSVIFFCQTDR